MFNFSPDLHGIILNLMSDLLKYLGNVKERGVDATDFS